MLETDTAWAMPGIWSGLFAFFDAHGRLDRSAMRLHVQALADAGCQGVVALGETTSTQALSQDERLDVIRWAHEDVFGRIPVAVDVPAGDPETQLEFSLAAIDAGASLLILPGLHEPQGVGHSGAADSEPLIERYADLLERLQAEPLGAQIPVILHLRSDTMHEGLSPGAVEELADRCDNIHAVVCDAAAVTLERAVARLGRRVPVVSTRGGLELIEHLQAGCSGAIVAPEVADLLRRAHRLLGEGRPGAAQLAYEHALPTLTFTSGSAEIRRCYGRRIAARRLGLGPVQDRAPALAPTPFGLKTAREHADRLGLYARDHA